MKRVIARLTGGFGNQCFVYAAARSCAIDGKAKLILQDAYTRHGLRHFALGDFCCRIDKVQKLGGIVCSRIDSFLRNRRIRFLRGELTSHKGNRYYNLKGPSLALPQEWSGTLWLDGFFQAEKLFYHHREEILNDFILKEDAWVDQDKMVQMIRNERNSVFCHVRSYKDAKPDGSMALPVSFYRNAVRILADRLGGGVCFLVSDDLEWAYDRLHAVFHEKKFDLIPVSRDNSWLSAERYTAEFLRDFTLMRECHHAIVANSTFSWWAAWLMEQNQLRFGEHPIILRPARGGDGYREESNEFWPERWVQVSVG